MSVVRVNIIVEGQTEEAFVKEVLTQYLSERQVYPRARRVTTQSKGGYRGGMTTYGKAQKDIENWLKQDASAYCTTMFDLYDLPSDFPGYEAGRRLQDPYARVAHLEAEFAKDIDHRRFIPFFLLHEFEALLLSDPSKLDEVLAILQGASRLIGVLIAEAIGIDGIRKQCPHFNEWITKLEHLTPSS